MSSLRPSSAVDPRTKARLNSTSTIQQFHSGSSSAFGSYSSQQQRRPMLGNYSNMTSSILARDKLGGYSQDMGTISQ